MKRIITIALSLITLIFTLSSCEKTDFSKLEETKRQEIIDFTMNSIKYEIEKAKKITTDTNLSMPAKNRQIKDIEKQIILIFDEKVRTKYSDVIFLDYKQVTSKSKK